MKLRSIRRLVYNVFINKRYLFSVLCISICSILLMLSTKLYFASNYKPNIETLDLHIEPIDVVYTWVNGSDEKFIENLYLFSKNRKVDKRDTSDQRFEDKYELKFSLRSLEKFAPWIRHVYIVTNGQIPYWLNLDYEKVSIVTHDEIFLNKDHLPTFSSPAIESHIHRIPNLSTHFLYFNDDLFLYNYIYLEDFLTHANGYKIYLSWPLPDCSDECSWSYLQDGSCDQQCNNENCQFDGGDCIDSKGDTDYDNMFVDNNEEYEQKNVDDDFEKRMADLNKYVKKLNTKIKLKPKQTLLIETNRTDSSKYNTSYSQSKGAARNNESSLLTDRRRNLQFYFDKAQNAIIKNVNNTYDGINLRQKRGIKTQILQYKREVEKSKTAFAKFIKNDKNITEAIREFNKKIILRNKSRRKVVTDQKKADNDADADVNLKTALDKNSVQRNNNDNFDQDTYANSLVHVNKLYNLHYGFKARKVVAHMPLFVNKDIMNSLQREFKKEFEHTSSNKFRSNSDMQYSFSYVYYLMNEKRNYSISEIFDIFDTDKSSTLSDREIRTLLTRLNELPLTYEMVNELEDTLINCSKNLSIEKEEIVTPLYERYLDSKLPIISKKLVKNCPKIIKVLMEHFSTRYKYNFEVLKSVQLNYVTFRMLTSNLSHVVGILDEVRKYPKKFICLNDNMESGKTEENNFVKTILNDFYLSLFPLPSKFELPSEFRNRFAYVHELEEWKSGRQKLKLVIYICVIILCMFFICNFRKLRFCNKIKRCFC